MKEYHTQSPLSITAEQKLLFKKSGIQNRVFDKLKKGQFPIQEECDLHGLTTIEAERLLTVFLNDCFRQHLYCVRIIHGKGHGSLNQLPILKNFVCEWLKQKELVLAFSSAKPNDGGAGALYVLLKR
ncbi:MAG: Smr/MutS family protein [Gammaproteobacteria bacterium]|nr:Smr/MutS family protein [Gammaproteobacteria bacterium]